MTYLDSEWSKPNRSDFYLMQIALEIRRFMTGFSKGGKIPEMSDLILPFGLQRVDIDSVGTTIPKEEVTPTPEEIKNKAEISKANWFARTGQLPKSHKKS